MGRNGGQEKWVREGFPSVLNGISHCADSSFFLADTACDVTIWRIWGNGERPAGKGTPSFHFIFPSGSCYGFYLQDTRTQVSVSYWQVPRSASIPDDLEPGQRSRSPLRNRLKVLLSPWSQAPGSASKHLRLSARDSVLPGCLTFLPWEGTHEQLRSIRKMPWTGSPKSHVQILALTCLSWVTLSKWPTVPFLTGGPLDRKQALEFCIFFWM